MKSSVSDPFLVFESAMISGFQDDESLRRWKEQLLGSVDINSVGGNFFFQNFQIRFVLNYITFSLNWLKFAEESIFNT